jgi:hypothetical protein
LFAAGATLATFPSTVRACNSTGFLCGFATVTVANTTPVGPSLGTAQTYGILAGSTVTCVTGGTINAAVGVSPGSTTTGFPPCTITGATHLADATAATAQNDLTTAYNALAGLACGTNGHPGGHRWPDAPRRSLLRRVVDGRDRNSHTRRSRRRQRAVRVPDGIHVDNSARTPMSRSSTVPRPRTSEWQVGKPATLGTGTTFRGNILALTSITLVDNARCFGRALARNGAVSLGTNNTITLPWRFTHAGAGAGDHSGPHQADAMTSKKNWESTMCDQILKSVRTLAALLPLLALAQPMAAQNEGQQREGSWEWSAGAGLWYTDGALNSFLGSSGFGTSTDPSRLAPAAAVRVGYNVSNHWGFSIGTSGAKTSGIKFLTPFAAATYTANLNAKFSPFFTGGTQFTRITGNNGRKTHPTWGAQLGVGIRSMLGDRTALRLEGRMGIEHYEDLPEAKTAYNSILTLGLSFFTGGRGVPPIVTSAAPCPVCALARVDTVWRTPPAAPPRPIVLRDTLVLEGINFAYDSSALTPESYGILDRVAQALLAPEWANSRWQIAGHTSGIGTHEYNMALSQRRAEAVRDYLIGQGVPAYKMTAVGYGEGFPIAPNATVEGRALNRRGIQLRVKKP